MDCDKCKIKMEVQNTYRVDGTSSCARHICPKCNTVCTSVTVRIFKHPVIGQGAYSVAQQMKKDKSLKNKTVNIFENKPDTIQTIIAKMKTGPR